jgi:hypothetical protein
MRRVQDRCCIRAVHVDVHHGRLRQSPDCTELGYCRVSLAMSRYGIGNRDVVGCVAVVEDGTRETAGMGSNHALCALESVHDTIHRGR